MRSWRKKENFPTVEKNVWSADDDNAGSSSVPARNLSKANLGGVIFGCKLTTISECFTKQLFGLSGAHISYVRNVEPGLPLFLFNHSDRKLHGIFEAATHGRMNIDPYGWSEDGKHRSPYPAQVCFFTKTHCQPLAEAVFRPIISDNYYTPHHFHFELDHSQTRGLLSLFAKSPSFNSNAKSFSIPLPIPRKGPQERESAVALLCTKNGSSDGSSCSKEERETNAEGEREVSVVGPSVETISMKLRMMDHSSSAKSDIPETSCSSSSQDNSALVQMIEELRVRVGSLEKKQVESEREVWELRKAARECCQAAQGLAKHAKELESKLAESGASASQAAETPNELTADFSAVPGESVYIIGGFDGGSWLSALDSYSLSLDLTTSLRPMSAARPYASAAALDGCLYVIGGDDGSLWYDTVECYDPGRDEWRNCPPLTRGKGSMAGATLNGKIFAIGGGNELGSLSDVQMIDLVLGRWINHQSMLQKRFALAAAELGGALYSVGGFDGECYLRSGERFDPREGFWTRIPSMKTARGCHSMAVLNNNLYVVGGYDGKGVSAGVEIYDPRATSWYAGEDLNLARGYAAAAVVGGSLYAIGGVTFENAFLDAVERYSEGSGWSVTNLSAVGKRAFFSAIVL